ncbi:hypothetical protein FS837_011798 [Tulasnella sp. UAMH 9824]|nr:hypothetical protein FS837_011798 [Tulasnella sp. UAMH 9824]
MCTIAERATRVLQEIREVEGWHPVLVYEPFEGVCTPQEYPKLAAIMGDIDILSPNAEEALRMLEIPLPVTTTKVEEAATTFIEAGVKLCVIIRCAGLGAYALETGASGRGFWTPAFWAEKDIGRIVDVTGAGNSFLGGLSAGLAKSGGDVKEGIGLVSWSVASGRANDIELVPFGTSNALRIGLRLIHNRTIRPSQRHTKCIVAWERAMEW